MAQAAALSPRATCRREIIDYANAGKPDAPSGTAASWPSGSAPCAAASVPPAQTAGAPEARGADIAGTQVHSLRLPSFAVSTEVVFALPDERLLIRHDAGRRQRPTSPARCSPPGPRATHRPHPRPRHAAARRLSLT